MRRLGCHRRREGYAPTPLLFHEVCGEETGSAAFPAPGPTGGARPRPPPGPGPLGAASLRENHHAWVPARLGPTEREAPGQDAPGKFFFNFLETCSRGGVTAQGREMGVVSVRLCPPFLSTPHPKAAACPWVRARGVGVRVGVGGGSVAQGARRARVGRTGCPGTESPPPQPGLGGPWWLPPPCFNEGQRILWEGSGGAGPRGLGADGAQMGAEPLK